MEFYIGTALGVLIVLLLVLAIVVWLKEVVENQALAFVENIYEPACQAAAREVYNTEEVRGVSHYRWRQHWMFLLALRFHWFQKIKWKIESIHQVQKAKLEYSIEITADWDKKEFRFDLVNWRIGVCNEKGEEIRNLPATRRQADDLSFLRNLIGETSGGSSCFVVNPIGRTLHPDLAA